MDRDTKLSIIIILAICLCLGIYGLIVRWKPQPPDPEVVS